MDQYSREFIAEKARLRPEDLGLVRTARRSHNQLGLAYQIAFIRLTGRAPGQQSFEILEEPRGLCGNGAECESPRSRSLCAARQPTLSARRARTVGVRVTAAEAAELRERAQAARLSMGAYLG